MKRTLLVALLAAGFGVLCAGVVAYTQDEASSPFYAESTQFTVESSTGERFPFTINKRFALNSDGDYYEMQTNVDLRRNQSISGVTIMDWETSKHVTMLLRAKVKNTLVLRRRTVPHAHCTDEILASPPAGKYLGLDAVEVVKEAEDRRTRSVYIPSLSCLRVFSEAKIINPSGEEVTTVFQVDYLSAGEPDPHLFEVPEDYEEVGPAEAMFREIEATQFDLSAESLLLLQGQMDRAEERYQAEKW